MKAVAQKILDTDREHDLDLREYDRVVFKLGASRFGNDIRVSIREDGSLEINADGPISIRPSASNNVTIRLE